MADEDAHRQHEMDALLEASMGEPTEQRQDDDEWYKSVSEKLKLVSGPLSGSYAETIAAITALQEIAEEVINHQGFESMATDLFATMATKQEQLFSVIVDFHHKDLSRLTEVISGVDNEVGGASPTGGYVNREKQLNSLQRSEEMLARCGTELDVILEAPLPLEIPSASEEEDEGAGHTPSVYGKAVCLHNKAEMLHLKLQSTSEPLQGRLQLFEENLQQERERFLTELGDVEEWLTEVYSVVRMEPNRAGTIAYTPEEVRAFQEEYSDEGVTADRGLTLPEQIKPDNIGDGAAEQFSVHREVSISGSSLGSDLLELGVGPEILETSVDVELGDDEYQKQVMEQVLSGSSASPSPKTSPSPSPLEQAETSSAPLESSVDPFDDPVDPVGGEWAESMEEETDVQTETASVSSADTLRDAPDRSPDSKKTAGAEFSEEEVNPEGVKEEMSEHDKQRGEKEEGETVGRSLADELSDLGIELEQDVSDKEVKSEDDQDASEESGGGDSGSEGGSEVSSEGAGLHWVARLRILPMYCGAMTEGEDVSKEQDLDHILQELEAHSSQLQSQNHKIKSAMANINFIINASSPDTARELQARLMKVKVQWEPLALQLKQRREQLLFEKTQTIALDSLHEAVRELDGQPQSNLTHQQTQDSYSQLMEFFQDVDLFAEQSRDHVSQLESTLQPLLGQREGLLGDGKGAGHLLQNVVEEIREGYKLVEDQLKVQKLNLEQWLEEWSTFHSALSQFQDWVGHAEGVVSRDCYGNDVVETERYLKSIQGVKAQLPGEERRVEQLVEYGNTLLQTVEKGSLAEAEVDQTLTECETRWYNLVEKIEGLDSSIRKVLISWQAYSTMYRGARSFISQMTNMVGTEPVESSHGNTHLLPTYRTYADQLRAMAIQYDKLLEFSNELTGNEAIGGRDSIGVETRELRSDWERLKDNVMDSLALLQREYDDWVHHQLQKMSSIVQQIGEIVARETRYVEEMPLATFLEEDTETLLRQADDLIVCQDQLAQLESECASIDELLLERATEQSTRQSLGEEDSPRNTEDHLQLQAARDRYQLISEVLLPVINIFYLQLQLLQKIQEGREVVVRAMETAGNQQQLESLLTDINLSLSEDHYDQLRSEAYDLGTVSEDCELDGHEQHGVTLPPYEQLVQVNRSLTGEIESLSDDSATAKIRLQLFIEWWAEFHSNHGDLTGWLEEAESRVDLLEARAESVEIPLVSPVELLADAKELQVEMSEKTVLLSALKATSQNIVEEFAKEREGEDGRRGEGEGERVGDGEGGETVEEDDEMRPGVVEKVEVITRRWEELSHRLEVQCELHEESSDKFNSFTTRFTSFCNWLSEVHSQLQDEVCVAIPDRATADTITVHRARLQEFRDVVTAHKNEFDLLCREGGQGSQWGDYLVPEDTQNNLPSDDSQPQSPVALETEEEDVDFPFGEHLEQLPYFRNKMHAVTANWGGVQRLLRDRENQLEMSLGNMVVFLEGVEEVLTWIQNQTVLECLCSIPPADLTLLKHFQTSIGELCEAMTGEDPARLGLLRTAENLIGQISGPNAAKVTEKANEVKEKWVELEITIETRKKALNDIIDSVEVLLVRVGECEGVLEEGEGRMTECGPIGADPVRLVQQQEILDALDEDLLAKKKIPEELASEAMNIIRGCLEGSGGEMMTRVRNLQNRFDELSERCYESRELCEEATAALQAYVSSETAFSQWLTEASGMLSERTARKRPIGTIHNEKDDFLDFMKEVEQHSEQYGPLRNHGNQLAAKYKPSDALDEMMSSLYHQWEEFVCQLCSHFDKLHSLAERWDKYERDVKNLLNWIMTEANQFCGEVTVQGDKGVEDHIESCKVFSETLEGKKEKVQEIQALAEDLRESDGEKSNGTCDVDSRWNDVNQHWASLCKLLLETLVRLEATHAEVQHILMIRDDEFDWLTHVEKEAADRCCCCGDVGRVEEEIVRQQQLLSEVEGHNNESEFISKTVEFLLEHTVLAEREDIKEKAADFNYRYGNLLTFLKTYVGNLKASVPIWKEFNAISQELREWLDHAQLQLTSDLTQPGNAIVTETSLRNVELLTEEVSGHKGTLHTLTTLTSSLAQLTTPGDKEYVCGVRDQLVAWTGDLEEQTRDRTESLEQRLKSWEVFPVAEAQAVQLFLQQVEVVMGREREGERGESGEEEEGEEEGEEVVEEKMNCEQLMKKLKKLEDLQRLQEANREKLTAITQSVEKAEVQAALERNPDISKERSNLLQGWSATSEALSQRIMAMKQQAEMMGEVEDALERVCEAVREFGEDVDRPLPPSDQLEPCHDDITQRQSTLQEKCTEELNGLENLFDRYSTRPELVIPVHITEKATTARENFNAFNEKAEQKTELLTTQLAEWAELNSLLPRLFDWVRGAQSELTCLKKVPDFATEFSSLESRLEGLKEQISENADSVERLQLLSDHHICHHDDQTTPTMRKQVKRISDSWRALNEGVEKLTVAMAPWKELTDRFDQLQDWFDEFRDRVRRDLSDLEQEEDELTDLSDYVVLLKDHLLKMEQQTGAMVQLTNQRAELISRDICKKHGAAGDLDEQITALDEMWAGQEQLLRHTLNDVQLKQAEWRQEAVSSIQYVRSLSSELSDREETLQDKEREIEWQRAEIAQLRCQLQSARPPPPPLLQPSSSSSLFKFLTGVLLLLLTIFIFLTLFLHDLGPHLDLSPLVFQLSTTSFKPI